ncbi:MAG: hypothetical protein LBF60_04180, partial [Treponema sp.]|nr:hypothetical protein [Treponema sp.]
GGKFGDYTKITVKFLLNDENESTSAPIIRLYGSYAAGDFSNQTDAYHRAANTANTYLVFNDNMWARNTWNGETLSKNSLPKYEWFTVEIPFDLSKYSSSPPNFPSEDATGDLYFALGLGLGGGTGSATHYTSYMTGVTLSNADGTKKIVSTGGGLAKPAVIADSDGHITVE